MSNGINFNIDNETADYTNRAHAVSADFMTRIKRTLLVFFFSLSDKINKTEK